VTGRRMAKRNRSITSAKIDKWKKEGRGQGYGIDYKPSLTIRDVPSKGLSTRSKGKKIPRVYHTLSMRETGYLRILEWSEQVVDIREQYSLPLQDTLDIAERFGIKHPVDPKTKEYVPLSTDFLIDIVNILGQRKVIARTVKLSKDLDNVRTLEKFQIERIYWAERDIDWGIVTEKEISSVFAENIKTVSKCKILSDFPSITPQIVSQVELILFEKALNEEPLAVAARMTDQMLNLKQGTSLTIFYYLVANKVWIIDMEEPLDTGKTVSIARSGKKLNVMGEKF
jgi:hypothetical protein